MKSISKYLNRQNLAIFILLLMMIGLVFSKYLTSMTFFFIIGLAFLNPRIISVLKKLSKHRAFLALTFIFFIYLMALLYSEDKAFAINRLRMSLPFLLLPMAFFTIPKMDNKTYFRLLSFFFYLMVGTCLVLSGIYLADVSHYTELYKQGQIFPTPTQHIRFSLLICVAISIGIYLFTKNFFWNYALEKKVMLGLVAFLIIFLHVLAVRSGLLAFYLLLIFFAIYSIVKTRKYKLAGWLFAGALIWGVIGSRYIPTLNNKIGYMRYSIEMFLKNEDIKDLSDSRRLASIKAGLEIGKENPFFGTGIGDIRHETDEYLKKNYPALAGLNLMPHNQYIFYFAATGFVGLLFFIGFSFYPLFWKNAYRDLFFAGHHIIFFSSFLVEHTLETQIGATSYLFFLLLAIRNFDFRS